MKKTDVVTEHLLIATSNAFQTHFGSDCSLLIEKARSSVDNRAWIVNKEKKDRIGSIAEYLPEGHEKSKVSASASVRALIFIILEG